MFLQPQTVPSVPEETVRVARAAFPKGNFYLQLRDEIGVLFEDNDFVDLFPARGQPAYAPRRLALITIFQYGRKRQLQRTGYKIYLTETCDDDLPRLITNVETSSAPVADYYLTEPIHQS